jgi:hypothetical protein
MLTGGIFSVSGEAEKKKLRASGKIWSSGVSKRVREARLILLDTNRIGHPAERDGEKWG